MGNLFNAFGQANQQGLNAQLGLLGQLGGMFGGLNQGLGRIAMPDFYDPNVQNPNYMGTSDWINLGADIYGLFDGPQ